MKNMKNVTLNMCLCKGRHEIPEAVDGALFPMEIRDVTDTESLESIAFNRLWDAAFRHHKRGNFGFLRTSPEWDGSDMEPLCLMPGLTVNLYVTGLTVALIAAINVCKREGLNITLWHYNRDTEDYYPQQVF